MVTPLSTLKLGQIGPEDGTSKATHLLQCKGTNQGKGI